MCSYPNQDLNDLFSFRKNDTNEIYYVLNKILKMINICNDDDVDNNNIRNQERLRIGLNGGCEILMIVLHLCTETYREKCELQVKYKKDLLESLCLQCISELSLSTEVGEYLGHIGAVEKVCASLESKTDKVVENSAGIYIYTYSFLFLSLFFLFNTLFLSFFLSFSISSCSSQPPSIDIKEYSNTSSQGHSDDRYVQIFLYIYQNPHTAIIY